MTDLSDCINSDKQVRSEARKVHDLFFDIMKIAFPDTDFREARSALSFSGSMASSSSPRGLLPPKRPKPMMEVEPEPSLPPRPVPRGSNSIPSRETRFGRGAAPAPAPAHGLEEPGPRVLTHPGELVICKKKRKDREKSGVVRPGNGGGLGGPVSPIARGIRSPVQGQGQSRGVGQSQQLVGQQANVGWANPVKRMRTDAGKRRPSQL